jgi:hypothetical protein
MGFTGDLAIELLISEFSIFTQRVFNILERYVDNGNIFACFSEKDVVIPHIYDYNCPLHIYGCFLRCDWSVFISVWPIFLLKNLTELVKISA